MYKWFHPNGDLKENYKCCIEFGTYFAKSKQYCSILMNYPLFKEEICTVLCKQRDVGQPLYTICIQPLIEAIIAKRKPQLLESNNNFPVSIGWTRSFIKSKLNWSYRASTIATSKLPKDYELQGKIMAQRCAYLIKVHNIPQELVVNIDQTSIHLILIGGAKTWVTKSSKHVNVHSVEDKRQIIVVVSSSAKGVVLPFQVIF